MTKRKLLLWFLTVVITLPILLSFSAAVCSDSALDEDTYAAAPFNIPEEESKEDESEFEKEKNLPSWSYTLPLSVSILKSNEFLFSHSKPIHSGPELPYNPPELS